MRALIPTLMIVFQSYLLHAAAVRPHFRSELPPALHALLCQKAEAPSPMELWAQGVYDTQAEIGWIYAERSLNIEELRKLAMEQASSHQHSGYAFALCNDRHAWILTTHSSGQLMTPQKDGLRMDTIFLKERCETFQLDLAPFDKNPPEKIIGPISPKNREHISLTTEKLSRGTLSLTCFPFDSKQNGPELWSLFPLGELTNIPVIKEIRSISDLTDWIQSRRVASGLKQLGLGHPKLDSIAKLPNPSRSLAHPRPWLLKQKSYLAAQGLYLLGENRVKGKSLTQMAWLLWNSAQHRRLLLSPEAEWMSFQLENTSDEKLIIIYFAREISLAQSKDTSRKPN